MSGRTWWDTRSGATIRASIETNMTPVGYMAKRVCSRPGSLNAPKVVDVYSVSSCVSDDFADYIEYWKHNGNWLFDSPEIIQTVAREASVSLEGTTLFYYEAHEMQFRDECWEPFSPEASVPTDIVPPSQMQLEGFDVVTFVAGNSPECSPLSCNSLAETFHTNEHCLSDSFEESFARVETGDFKHGEPGPYRIFAVYSVRWPRT